MMTSLTLFVEGVLMLFFFSGSKTLSADEAGKPGPVLLG